MENLPHRPKRSSLKPCPKHGDGVNVWLLSETRRQYKRYGPALVKRVRAILYKGSARCGRAVSQAEVERALRKAWDEFEHFPGDSDPNVAAFVNQPKWPVCSREKMEAIHKQYAAIECGDLEAKSPVKNPRALNGRDVLPHFFRPEEFVCLGSERWSFDTWPRDEALRYAAGCRYIVPNPFKSATGLTKDGKPTTKSDSQVATRRFVVVEFDFKGKEWANDWSLEEKIRRQVRLHLHLAHTYPLALVVFSGNESLHGWYVADPIERHARAMLERAVELGADHSLWALSQFTRTPGATHQNGQRQRVIYFAPEVVKL